ncbi:hypothetical protein HPULCUR_005077 [Helicostylum pulchrum]|uniref:Uncharacterized protein n=1 Tax=Helicostylum pulchrum TaxID=562976 RepID=A0ABP9XY88_9FUNG
MPPKVLSPEPAILITFSKRITLVIIPVKRGTLKQSKTIAAKATCYKSDPNNVVLYHTGNHNHQIAGLEDSKFLPLSQVAKQLNEQILCKGFRKRDTKISIQNNFLRHSQANFNIDVEQSLGNKAQVIVHRDRMVHSTEKKHKIRKIPLNFG